MTGEQTVDEYDCSVYEGGDVGRPVPAGVPPLRPTRSYPINSRGGELSPPRSPFHPTKVVRPSRYPCLLPGLPAPGDCGRRPVSPQPSTQYIALSLQLDFWNLEGILLVIHCVK